MQCVDIFHMEYTSFIKTKEMLNRNHDYAILRSK